MISLVLVRMTYPLATRVFAWLALLCRSTAAHDGEYPRASLELEYRLRRAALADRLALSSRDEHDIAEAACTAYELLAFDPADGRPVLGPAGPGSPAWQVSARPYVRQEYEGWAQLTDGGRDAWAKEAGDR
ncbi:hypothetical protein [Kitasatospora aureofaciens]|uniref:hypothetical protein n=1 Tax=Kitasatospora aureofaciens TaxID=1894 RepID=UPI000524F9AC|nr:hypothetical protein [Kitasatospora aureofaciens]